MKKQPSPYFKGDNFPALNREAPKVVTENINTFRIESLKLLQRMAVVLSKENIIAVDTETNGLNAFSSSLFLIQIASPLHCFIIDVEKFMGSQSLFKELCFTLRGILEDNSKLKLLQNAKFDYKMLKAKLDVSMNNMYDSMLAERLLTAGTGAEVNLAAIALKYSEKHLDKRVRASFVGLLKLGYMSKEQLEYAAEDVFCLFDIYRKQLSLLAEHSLLPVADLEFNCISAVADMELAGIKIDTAKWKEIIKEAEEKKTEIQSEVMKMLPDGRTVQMSLFGDETYEVNLNSGPQIIKQFAKLGIDLPDTSQKTLKNNKSKHKAIGRLLDYRKQEKIISAFGEELLAKIDKTTGRIHPEFMQYGANTGRMSCISSGTKILMPGEYRNIEDVNIGDYVYSYLDTKPVIRKVLNKYNNGERECLKLNWVAEGSQRKGELICTPEHRIFVLGKGWIEAKNLRRGMKPLFLAKTNPGVRGRPYLHWNGRNIEEEQVVIKHDFFNELNPKMHIHHKDENKSNNRLDNLVIVSQSEHSSYHSTKRYERSRFSVLRELAIAKGKPTKCKMDYETIQSKVKYHNINISIIKKMYGENGMYLGKGSVLNALKKFDRVDYSASYLGVGTRKLKELCELYGFEYNHSIISIEPVGIKQVWDLEIEGTHNFIANELCVHNCTNPNVQQIPSDSHFRECFVPKKGYKFIVCDFQAVELRILAQLSGDESFLKAFNDGQDLHSVTASRMFRIPIEEVTKDRRRIAKFISFSLAYGSGPRGVAELIGDVTVEEAKDLMDKYFQSFPDVKKYLDKAGRDTVKNGYTLTMMGRKCMFPLPDKNDIDYKEKVSRIERQGKNSSIQGLSADILKISIVNLNRKLKNFDARIVSMIHDEVVVEVLEEHSEEVRTIVQKEMESAEAIFLTDLPSVAEAKIADYWTK